MTIKKMGWLSLVLCFLVVSCKKEEVVNPVNPNVYEIPVKEVFAPLSGAVFNEAGNPVAGALVKVGTSSGITDDNGVFNFENATLNEYGSPVSISKIGYFETVQMVNGKAGKRSDIRVMLLRKTIVGSVMANVGGTLTANGNSKITLPANGIIDEAGNAYSGEVKVAAKWLDPTVSNLNEMMPGDLRAISEEQELVQLATYGMMAVELEGSAGEVLNIAEGSVAKLEFPVPATLQGGAPATIPLWSFNETTGHWEEEGQATFDGQKYVGDVSHFSFWNCDAPFPVVEMEGALVDKKGNPLVGYTVSIKVNSSALIRSGYTDDAGAFSGKIPKDREMTLSVYYPGCDNSIYTQVIGPFSTAVSLAPITIDLSNVSGWNLNLSGLMENCNSEVLTKGYLKVTYDGGVLTLFPDDNTGELFGSIYFCANITSVDLEGFDTEGQKEGVVTSFVVMEGSDLDFGLLSICQTPTESLEYSIDGVDFFIFDPEIFLSQDSIFISGMQSDSIRDRAVSIRLSLQTVPFTQNPNFASFSEVNNNLYSYGVCGNWAQDCTDFEVEITALGAPGEFAKGTFAGTMKGSGPGNISTISGSFVIEIE